MYLFLYIDDVEMQNEIKSSYAKHRVVSSKFGPSILSAVRA